MFHFTSSCILCCISAKLSPKPRFPKPARPPNGPKPNVFGPSGVVPSDVDCCSAGGACDCDCCSGG